MPKRMWCNCGCGNFAPRSKRFIKGHHTSGFSGRKHSDESKGKTSKAVSGKNHPLYGLKGPDHPAYGYKHSSDSIRRMSEAQIGEKNHMHGRSGKNHPLYGKRLDDEHKKKISDRMKGENHPLFGKHLPEETKRKISEANKGKPKSEETKRKLAEYKGPRASNWRGGISCGAYCDIWYTREFRDLINERDGDRCWNPLCRHTSRDRPFHFHHINYDKSDCNPKNVIKVCASCNTRANHNRRFWQKHYENIIVDRGLNNN